MSRALGRRRKRPRRSLSTARSIRINDLVMVHGVGLGHLGGEFSAMDILTTLFFGVLRIDPTRPTIPNAIASSSARAMPQRRCT